MTLHPFIVGIAGADFKVAHCDSDVNLGVTDEREAWEGFHQRLPVQQEDIFLLIDSRGRELNSFHCGYEPVRRHYIGLV